MNLEFKLRVCGAIPIIVKLMKSNNDEVRFNACWAISCCASDYLTAVEFCRHEAIETLRDINQSSQRKSSLTEAALRKLLETNLSAKYALTNYLGKQSDSLSPSFLVSATSLHLAGICRADRHHS